MTQREAQLKYENLKQQLTIFNQHPEEAIEYYGSKRAVEERINQILDEMIELKKIIKNSI